MCCFFVASCAHIEYQRITDDTGLIMDKIVIELDRSKIIEKIGEEKYINLKNDIREDLKTYVEAITASKLELQRRYEGKIDFINNVLAEQGEWMEADLKTDRIVAVISYANIDFYKLINGIPLEDDSSETDDDAEIVSNWFVSKYIIKANNTFTNLESIGGEPSYYDYYSTKYSEFGVQDVSLTQVYGTTDTRLKSNADYIEKIDGINYHLWDIDTQNEGYKTCQLSYYYTTAVGTGWYIVALALSIALALVLITVWIIKVIKAKHYKTKINLTDDTLTK